MNEYKENMEFEAEVRRVAEAAWGLEPGECQPQHYEGNRSIRELDGVARTRDVTHLIMATVSRKLEKAKSDVKKLNAAEAVERSRSSFIKKWLVTREQLDAEHIAFARSNGVEAITLEQFRRRFFDYQSYIAKRRVYAFGSARNLSDGSTSVPENEYAEVPMFITKYDGRLNHTKKEMVNLKEIISYLANGEVIIILAPFGSGKSLTIREIFKKIASSINQYSGNTPIVLNLREHWGQEYPDEILERHARALGFTPKENVNVAWRAGMAHIVLDGFDELSGQVVARLGDVNFMREARHRALVGVRRILNGATNGSGILIAGRDHYFDDIKEMVHSLGIDNRRFNIVELGEFTEDQAKLYLISKGVSVDLPSWLPRKPLLLGYLSHNKLLESVVAIDSSKGFGYAWDNFLDMICRREATHESGAIESDTLRHILESIACGVRATISGSGPIYGRDLSDAYFREVGFYPDEPVIMQLQRLPGLTQRDQDKGARAFVDIDMLNALQGSFIARYILGEIREVDNKSWQFGLSPRSIDTALYVLESKSKLIDKELSSLIIETARRVRRENLKDMYGYQLVADCVLIAIEAVRDNSNSISFGGLLLESAYIDVLNIEEVRTDDLVLRGCVIKDLYVDITIKDSKLKFEECIVGKVHGVTNSEALPQAMFDKCEVASFEPLDSNASILRSSLPIKTKALASILRKMFVQSGSGRKINSFKRGYDDQELGEWIDKILRYLSSNGYIYINNEIAYPNREFMHRVSNILRDLDHSIDPLLKEIALLK
ncbi:hypothetical protein [Deinococcus aluminii]|uniref:AAA+ ATPase domain-containing protein n=1 Tax=Deinococcus aluminii TaxID=1656885 RepID=A0ABP9XE99_9DEIO